IPTPRRPHARSPGPAAARRTPHRASAAIPPRATRTPVEQRPLRLVASHSGGGRRRRRSTHLRVGPGARDPVARGARDPDDAGWAAAELPWRSGRRTSARRPRVVVVQPGFYPEPVVEPRPQPPASPGRDAREPHVGIVTAV